MIVTGTARTPTIVPFADEPLDGAAGLLAARHRAHRVAEPGLDPRYEQPDAAHEELAAVAGVDGASGVAARV